MPPQFKTLDQPLLLTTLVRGIHVDLSKTIIHNFVYGPTHNQLINTAKYDYQMWIMQSRNFMMESKQ